MSWPSLLTAQHSASSTTGATANFWAKPSHCKKDKQGTVDWYSCCCHHCYQMTTRSLSRCIIRPNSAICFSIWASQSLNMPAELLMSLTNHQPVPNSAKFCRNVEIPRKRANSAARLKILRAAENCGPYSLAEKCCRWCDVRQEHEQLQSRYQLLQTHCEDLEKTCAELGSQLSQ